jgi:hypothetical protein
VFNNTDDYEVAKAPSSAWMTHKLLDNNVSSMKPSHYAINGVDANGDAVIEFYPPPDGIYAINVNLKIKSVLSAGTDTTDVPWLPIVIRAQFLALDERGDDEGVSLQALDQQYNRALSDAVAFDAQLNEDETCWEVV